jgi:hypothetical protein
MWQAAETARGRRKKIRRKEVGKKILSILSYASAMNSGYTILGMDEIALGKHCFVLVNMLIFIKEIVFSCNLKLIFVIFSLKCNIAYSMRSTSSACCARVCDQLTGFCSEQTMVIKHAQPRWLFFFFFFFDLFHINVKLKRNNVQHCDVGNEIGDRLNIMFMVAE